jgi:hypothetical protein
MVVPSLPAVPEGSLKYPAMASRTGLLVFELPQDNEQRHHGCDKISVGNFPGAAVVAGVGDFFPYDDNGPGIFHH